MIISRESKGSPLTHQELDDNFREVENLKGTNVPENTLGVDGDTYVKIEDVVAEQDDNIYHFIQSGLSLTCLPAYGKGTVDFELFDWDGIEFLSENSTTHMTIFPILESGEEIGSLTFGDFENRGSGYTSVFINDVEYQLNIDAWDDNVSAFIFQSAQITSLESAGTPLDLNVSFMKVSTIPRADYYKNGNVWVERVKDVAPTLGNHLLPIVNTNVDYYNTTTGQFNIQGTELDAYILGIGIEEAHRKNGLIIKYSGEILAPSLENTLITDPKCLITKEFFDAGISTISGGVLSESQDHGITVANRVIANYVIPGVNSKDFSFNSVSVNSQETSGENSFAEGYGTKATGVASHAEGHGTISSAENSHAEGYSTTASKSAAHAEGHGSIASGFYSHAEGDSTESPGIASHAEGDSTKAIGNGAHAEGYKTVASGADSHAEGDETVASGLHSHAEGTDTVASGYASHASGYDTIALNESSFVIGSFNVGTNVNTKFEIGIGSYFARRNAMEVFKTGEILAPSLETALITDAKCLITKEFLTMELSNIPSPVIDTFKVVDTLPTPSLALFEKSRYSIADAAEYVCISSTTNPASDADCFWLQR